MPRKKKEEAPVEEIKIEKKTNSWTEKNNDMQEERYGGKEK